MNAKQHFVDQGDHFDLSAAASFLMLMMYAYDPAEPAAPKLRQHADMILARASTAGFGQADIFTTLIAQGEKSRRTLQLAEKVVAHVGGEAAMMTLIRDFKNSGKAGAA